MSSKLWFLQDLEEVISANKKDFGTGKNSWYNLLFTSVHIFIAQKFVEREKILKDMKSIYDEEKPIGNPIGFVLPSKKKRAGTLEFGLLKKDNVKKMQPIRETNKKLNEQLFILQNFLAFIYGINPKSDIFQDKYFSQLEATFEKWWEEEMIIQNQKAKEPIQPK